jgi:hypothetical protein
MKTILIPLIGLLGCVSLGERVKPAKFSYNERVHNSLIVDRIPQYGDTKKDGCIVENQINLSLKTLNDSTYIGKVQDVDTLEPLVGATVRIYVSNTKQPLIVTADQNGKFSFETTTEIKSLDVSYIGWRTLKIDFKRNHKN